MNIQLSGYLDRNFGDDMMFRLAAHGLREHKLYFRCARKEMLMPLSTAENIYTDNFPSEYACFLRVTGSGFLINRRLNTIYKIMELMKGKPNNFMSVIGCNVGPFAGKAAKMAIIAGLRRYSLITVRDSMSYEFVKANAPKAKVAQYPDILFGIPDEWLCPPTGEGCLGITAYRNTAKPVLNYNCYLGMADVADRFIEAEGKKVILLAFDTGSENDLSAAYIIKNMCRHPEMVEIAAHIDDGSEIIRNMARCGRIVAMRFHGSVLAMRMGIPFVPISYSDKTENMLSDIGFKNEIFKCSRMDSEQSKRIFSAVMEAETFPVDKDTCKAAGGHIELFAEELLRRGLVK